MFIQPFDTSLSMWFVPIPKFEWVPVPPPPTHASCAGEGMAEQASAGEQPGPMPPMQWVMTGFSLCAYRVWNGVPNHDWQVYMDNQHKEPEKEAEQPAPRKPLAPPVPRPVEAGAEPASFKTGEPTP